MAKTDILKNLLSGINKFSPGDLISTMELKDNIDSSKEELPQVVNNELLQLSDLLHIFILEGETDENLEKFNLLKERIYERIDDPKNNPSEAKTNNNENLGILIEDDEVLISFIQESHDHLDTIEERILTLENDVNSEIVDDIFRSMHTIKGVSSFIGLKKIQSLSHSLETILDKMRLNELEINHDLITVLLEGTDILVHMIGFISTEIELKSEGSHSFYIEEAPIEYDFLIEKINIICVDRIVNDSSQENKLKIVNQTDDLSSEELITDEMVGKFIEESSDLLDSAEHCILEIEKKGYSSDTLDLAFRDIHTIKGNSGFFGFNNIERISMETENLLDLIRKDEKKADQKNLSLILKNIDLSRNLLSKLSGPVIDISSVMSEHKLLGEVLVGMGISEEEVEHAASFQNKKIGEILLDKGVLTNNTLNQALKSQNKTEPGIASMTIKRKDIRIDVEKLDRLFDMVGELITAQAMVIDSQDLKGLELRDFNKNALYLSKITREIQGITMSMRMIPLEGLFNKMKRLVRDLSRKMDKPVNLIISGADTEMDRNVIEEIADPLVHIIRNSIDHGLEDQSSRKTDNKSIQGIIDLNARYEGNEIWITVKDDGSGLNREQIISKAIEKNLIKSEDSELEDKDIWKLIMEPGFSTAEKVSEISGRGVGMDVVKQNIEKIRGRIDINSEKGIGTEIILRIPLTLAIIDAISCKVGHMNMALPSTDVIEFLKPTENLFTQTNQKGKVINLRNEIIPIIDMKKFYNLNKNKREESDGVIVVVSAMGIKSALIVDEILGNKQMVLKALPEILEESRAISGCSLLGNGDVCLIVDVSALIKETLD